MSHQSLIPLSQLSFMYNIPTYYHFHHLQLSHAFAAQFPRSSCMVFQSGLERVLRMECEEKPAPHIYSHLIFGSPSHFEGLCTYWQCVIHALDNNDWTVFGIFLSKTLVSISDRLAPFKLVHRAYFTPHRLHMMNADISPECWWYGTSPGDFSHIVWHCPKVRKHWEEILALIDLVASNLICPSMEVRLLGLVETIVPTKRTLIGWLLFYARKNIAMQCKKPVPFGVHG